MTSTRELRKLNLHPGSRAPTRCPLRRDPSAGLEIDLLRAHVLQRRSRIAQTTVERAGCVHGIGAGRCVEHVDRRVRGVPSMGRRKPQLTPVGQRGAVTGLHAFPQGQQSGLQIRMRRGVHRLRLTQRRLRRRPIRQDDLRHRWHLRHRQFDEGLDGMPSDTELYRFDKGGEHRHRRHPIQRSAVAGRFLEPEGAVLGHEHILHFVVVTGSAAQPCRLPGVDHMHMSSGNKELAHAGPGGGPADG